MKLTKIAALLVAAVLMTACSTNTGSLTNSISFKENKQADVQNVSSVKDAVNISGIDIFKQSVKKDKNKNVIISPLSMFTAFSLLSNGAQGDTKSQIDKTFKIDGIEQPKLNQQMNDLINILNKNSAGENTGYINVYNSLWVDKTFTAKSGFLNTAKSFYDSDIFSVKLSDKSTVENMNKWVDKKSDGLIKSPFQSLSEQDKMVLVNLLNFKGKWVNKFDKSETKQEDFHKKDSTTQKVPLMNREGMMSYYEDKEAKACILPYYNGEMIVILPNANIDDYVEKLTNEKINTYSEKAINSKVKLKLPKFKTEYKNDMNDMLKSLGIKKAFDPAGADFSLIKDGSDPLWIGSVLHDCVIDVDEEGTSGAALTAVMLCGASIPKDTHEMYVNKPFIFVIRSDSGACLFIGKIENIK